MVDEPKTVPPTGPTDETRKTLDDPAGKSEPQVPSPKAETSSKPPVSAGVPAPKKPLPPPPKPPVKPEPWSSPLLEKLQTKFSGAVAEAVIFRGQPALTLEKDSLVAVAEFLKSEEGGSYVYLTDETAVDFPRREKRFEIVYHLYSFTRNDRLRLKVLAAEDERVPSVVGVWPVANWLEREIFDMFGVCFEGHPDLKRILLPDGWTGYPLRKDYDILRQDEAWVRENLKIESGQ